MNNIHNTLTITSSQNKIVVVDLILSRNTELYKQGMEVDIHNRNNDLKLREIVLELKDNLEKLIDNKVEGYKNYPKNSIFNIIITNFQKKGMTASTIRKIYDIFALPEYNVYKFQIYDRSSNYEQIAKEYSEKVQEKLDISGEKMAEDTKINEAIYILERNKASPRVHDYMRKYSSELEKQEIKQRREIQESEKIKIPLPDWIDKSQGGAESKTLDALLFFKSTIAECANRVFRYPPKSEKDDQYYADGIIVLAKSFEPGTDLKFTRDTLSYFDITLEMLTQSVHSAKSKSKITTPSGQQRGLTREQIGDMAEKYILFAHDFIMHIRGAFEFQEYLRREQKPFTGDFHISRHSKLSESAFGNASLCHHNDDDPPSPRKLEM